MQVFLDAVHDLSVPDSDLLLQALGFCIFFALSVLIARVLLGKMRLSTAGLLNVGITGPMHLAALAPKSDLEEASPRAKNHRRRRWVTTQQRTHSDGDFVMTELELPPPVIPIDEKEKSDEWDAQSSDAWSIQARLPQLRVRTFCRWGSRLEVGVLMV
eukprot:g31239.t1